MRRSFRLIVCVLLALTAVSQQTEEERERLRQLQSLPYLTAAGDSAGAVGVVGMRKAEMARVSTSMRIATGTMRCSSMNTAQCFTVGS